MIQVAVMGYGTVGSGVVEVIEKNKEEINKKSNEALNIKYILDLRDFPGDPYEYMRLVSSALLLSVSIQISISPSNIVVAGPVIYTTFSFLSQ